MSIRERIDIGCYGGGGAFDEIIFVLISGLCSFHINNILCSNFQNRDILLGLLPWLRSALHLFLEFADCTNVKSAAKNP